MIVVFGGAFNPPTIAHKEIYYLISKQFDLEKFIFLPVSTKYSKAKLIDDKHRIEMLKMMIEDLEKAEVSSMEMKDELFFGTYDSLLRIKEKYPNKDVGFVLGADNLEQLDHWLNAEKLVSEFKFIVINRHKKNLHLVIEKNPLLHQYQDHFIFLEEFHLNVSSTLFRETLDPYYVDEEIYHYIMKNDLYRGNH